jgi:hypothetical protein
MQLRMLTEVPPEQHMCVVQERSGPAEISVLSGVFRHLWLKQVVGWNPKHHCMRCLLGKGSSLIPLVRRSSNGFLELTDCEVPYLYLCGIHRHGYRYNLHVPMQRNPMACVDVNTPDIHLYIKGWQRLGIPPLSPEVIREQRLGWEFSSCRPYLFGARYLSPTEQSLCFDFAKRSDAR